MSERTRRPLACDNYEEGNQVGCTVGSMRKMKSEAGYRADMNPATVVVFNYKEIYKQIERAKAQKKEITGESLPECVIIKTLEAARTHDGRAKGFEPGE